MTKEKSKWRTKLHDIIYEADTPAGKWFDISLLILILVSIVLVMVESVEEIRLQHQNLIVTLEWVVTILFTLEYFARIITINKPKSYIFSFYGIIDFLSTIPMYLSFFFVGANAFIALRGLRLLRIFRILKLAQFVGESDNLVRAMKNSRAKIIVFLVAVLSMSIILGTLMYLVEAGQDSGFDSIPRSVYWTIVTLTTVGYGDIAPASAIGQFIAAIIMILGYGIIAVPTGIVSAEYVNKKKIHVNTQSCINCGKEGHKDEADFCYNCGNKLHD